GRPHRDREVGAAEVARQVHAHHPEPLEALDVAQEGGRVDDPAVLEADALLVDLPRAGGDLLGGVAPHLAEHVPVELARLLQAARAVLETEALLPEGHEALPGHPALEVELEVVVVGEEVHLPPRAAAPGGISTACDPRGRARPGSERGRSAARGAPPAARAPPPRSGPPDGRGSGRARPGTAGTPARRWRPRRRRGA